MSQERILAAIMFTDLSAEVRRTEVVNLIGMYFIKNYHYV